MTTPALPPDARAAVVTVSDRAYAGDRPDESGPVLAEGLRGFGFAVPDPVVVPDEPDRIAAAVRAAIDAGVDLVVTTGGTGLAPRDVTPEVVAGLIERPVPGLAEAVRLAGRERMPMTILTRAVAGIAGSTLVVTLPGSTRAVRDGLAVLAPVIGHAVAQLRGGGH